MKHVIVQQTVVQGRNGISFLGALFLVFLVLKLTAVITWSWWWVTAPLWGPFALFLSIVLGVLGLAIVFGLLFVLVLFIMFLVKRFKR
jgi:hypothetical protein